METSRQVEPMAWHRAIGAMIESIDKANFWNVLVRSLQDVVPFDNWVVLRFSCDARPVVQAESPAAGGGVDELFRDYLDGYYLLDPFYIACMDDVKPGLLRLDDVAPDNFESEDYYQRYFKLNITADEVQFNLPLAHGDVMILSLGGRCRYGAAEMGLLSAAAPWVVALMRQRLSHDEFCDDTPAGADRQADAAIAIADGGNAAAKGGLGPGSGSLTVRELEIMQLLLSGFSSKGIAQKLRISPDTVKGHRKHIYMKLGVKSHAELFAIYVRARAPI